MAYRPTNENMTGDWLNFFNFFNRFLFILLILKVVEVFIILFKIPLTCNTGEKIYHGWWLETKLHSKLLEMVDRIDRVSKPTAISSNLYKILLQTDTHRALIKLKSVFPLPEWQWGEQKVLWAPSPVMSTPFPATSCVYPRNQSCPAEQIT